MEIIDLPHDLFLLIVAHLSARALVRCRRVSRRWRDALTDQAFCLQLMKWHFPRCREMRIAYEHDDSKATDWTAMLTTVARRYHHLRTATPRSVDKIRIGTARGKNDDGHHHDNGGDDAAAAFFAVGTWDRYLRLDDKEAPFHYPAPSWCYHQDDAVLVYHMHPDDVAADDNQVRSYYYPWRLLDVETGATHEVPFPHDPGERIVRRVRLHDGVLVFEWCERRSYHQLNDRERCHRHFVTAFDLVRTPTGDGDGGVWTMTPRAEWKLHFLGFPLNAHDRFLSAHTATHYVVYVWQPNRSPWGEDDPIESVVVWDISAAAAPRIVRRMTWSTLTFYGVRQRLTPKLRHLALDTHNVYFVEEEHRWAQGGHSSLTPPRGHLVRCTGIPVITRPGDDDDADDDAEIVVQGPCWFDQCGADGDANMSFCTRSTTNLGPTETTTTTTTGSDIWHHPHHDTQQHPRGALVQEREAAARIATARWPGRAPCWRHEEFPYLTGK